MTDVWPATRWYSLGIRTALLINDRLVRKKYEGFFRKDADHGHYDTLRFEQRRFALMQDYLKDRRYGRALEVGCAQGHFTDKLSTLCDRIVAMDVSGAAVEHARRNLGDRQGVSLVRANIRDWVPEGDGGFDLIVLSEVLYHLGERADLLKALGIGAGSILSPLLRCMAAALPSDGRLLLAHSHARGARPQRVAYRELAEGTGLRLLKEGDVEPTGEPGTDCCVVSLLEKPA
ncbi:MAG: methyltransferase domain-containing protein [Elusimicrobia bacterium]|nr:methyltransferase domain-containing protein [Elusimicrobiota bacterium]